MTDRQSKKKKVVQQLDDASTSSSSSSCSVDSTLTDKSDMEFPKPLLDHHDSSLSPAEDTPPSYDPTRIPTSIFGCRQSTGADWSINSNESLFSITMGNNNSFSRDHAFIVYKSGELLRLDEVFSHPTLPPLAEADKFGPERHHDLISVAAPNKPAVKTKTAVVVEEEQGKKKNVRKPDDVSSCATSDESDTCSFAFPILINNKAEPIVKLPSLQEISTSLKKSVEAQPVKAPTSKPSGLSSWFSCPSFSCCPFFRRK